MRRRSGLAVTLLLAGLALAACDASQPEPTTIPVPTNVPTSVCMDAQVRGRVVAHATWGIALADSRGRVSKVIWPNGFHAVPDGIVLALVDGSGKVVARVGDMFEAGGGFIGANGDPDRTLIACGEMRVVTP